MPFTPFHLGPAALFKGIAGQRFSFMVFGGSQFLIDIEPGVRILLGHTLLHGPTHTLSGAVIIGTVAAFIGKPISEFVLRLLRIAHREITWFASAMGAFVGTFSHLILDGLTHTDMSPWFPITDSNPILGYVTIIEVQYMCLALGVLGVVIVYVRRRNDKNSEFDEKM